ncbi:MAG: hypothetical protein K2N49_01665 [Ruminococcus sp.]|nr:hypothetical protein [Ruminococcus sp.]MDE7225557.1 hypothetical protein [Ruminococcus sp.]
MKLSKKITAGILIIFIVMMPVIMILKKSFRFPEVSLKGLSDGSFVHEFEELFADGFSWRSMWVSASAEINSCIGEPIINGVYITDSRLIDTGSAVQFDAEKTAGIVNSFSEKCTGAVYFAAIPTSAGIYRDILPEYMSGTTEKQKADILYEKLNTDIRKIDAYSILKMLSDSYIYYRTDTKWTCYGAYCVYRTVVQKLGFMPVSYDKYTIRHMTDGYRGNLYSRTQYTESKSDQLDIYEYNDGTETTSCTVYDNHGGKYKCELYNTDAVETDNMYDLYLYSGQPLVKINTTVNNDRHLLVIGDEFVLNFVPFLTKHYSEISVLFPEYMEKETDYFVDTDKYEQTLILLGMDKMNILEMIK